LRAFAMRNSAPSSVLFHLNNALVQGLSDDRFTTALYGVLNPETRTIQLALGGHPPALVFREASGDVEIYEPDGAIIGAFDDQQYESTELKLEPGDVFLAYTDGLPEARAVDDLYGRDRIIESLKQHARSYSAKDLARQIYEDASSFGTVSDDTVVFALTSSKE
jgi:phosphoserine phosphatase RsbU/P